jgi:hypothetical protein
VGGGASHWNLAWFLMLGRHSRSTCWRVSKCKNDKIKKNKEHVLTTAVVKQSTCTKRWETKSCRKIQYLDRRCGSSGRASAWQTWSPEFSPWVLPINK